MTPFKKLVWETIGIVILFFLFNSLLFQTFNFYKWNVAGACMALIYSLYLFLKYLGKYLLQLDIHETETQEEEHF